MDGNSYTQKPFRSQRLRVVDAPQESAADDHAWFAANPGRRYRARFAHEAELRMIEAAGNELTPGQLLTVVVLYLPSGGVLLYETGLHSVVRADPAMLDENAAGELFHRFMRGGA